jgi:hypothetical protein
MKRRREETKPISYSPAGIFLLPALLLVHSDAVWEIWPA